MEDKGFVYTMRRLVYNTIGNVLAIMLSGTKVVVCLPLFYIIWRIVLGIANYVIALIGLHDCLLLAAFYLSMFLTYKIAIALPIGIEEWKQRLLAWLKVTEYESGIMRMVAWVLAWAFVLGCAVLFLTTFILDTSLTRCFMDALAMLGDMTGRALGIHSHLVVLGTLYLLDGLCLLSFLSLLIPVLRHKGDQAGSVYKISGVCCILSYTIGFVSTNFKFFLYTVGKKVTAQYLLLQSVATSGEASTAYDLMHTYLLPPLLALILNIFLFAVLLCNNREESLQHTPKIDNIEISREDAYWFQFLTEHFLFPKEIKDISNCFHNMGLIYLKNMTDKEADAIVKPWTAVHARKRIDVVRQNARIFYALTEEFGSFRNYVTTITHISDSGDLSPDDINVNAMIMANDMRNRGYKQIGPSTAIDLISDMFGIAIHRDHFVWTSDFFKKHR